jgi:hypothetical protein
LIFYFIRYFSLEFFEEIPQRRSLVFTYYADDDVLILI